MLMQASDYRYCTPIAAGIKGSVLPMVDGTAAARVNRYEDIAFLVEAARERYDWDRGRAYGRKQYTYNDGTTPSVIPDFESCGAVARRYTPLENLVSVVGDVLHTVDEDADYDGGTGSYSLAAEDWDAGLYGSSFPIISIPDDPSRLYPEHTSAYYLFQNAAIARSSTPSASVPRLVEGDTLRALYSDIAKMRRFVFSEDVQYPLHNVPFGDATFNARSERWMVALQTDDRSGLYSPRAAWSAPTEPYPDGRFSAYPGTLTFYIRKPFAVNALTQTRYYSTGTAYPLFNIGYVTEDSQDHRYSAETSAIFRMVNVPVSPVSTDNFEGSFTVDMTSSRLEGYVGLIRQTLSQSPLVRGSVIYVNIYLEGMLFDPGVVELPSIVPAAQQGA